MKLPNISDETVLYITLLSVGIVSHQFDFPAVVTALIVTVLATFPLQKSFCDYIKSKSIIILPVKEDNTELTNKVNELTDMVTEMKGSVGNLQMASGFRQLKGNKE